MRHVARCTKGVGTWTTLALLVIVGWFVDGCATRRVSTLSQPGMSEARVERIGVMPFLKGRHPTNVKQTLNCSLCQLAFDPASVALGAEMTLARYVQEAALARFGERVVPLAEVVRALEALGVDEAQDTPMSVARKVGEAVRANLMILGTIWRYRDRIGGPAGSTRPASVAFDLYVIDVPSGELLWMGNFDETQRALSENIFDAGAFFSRGAKWLSANELARYGVKEVFRQLPL
jgi:hypothetical protein